MQSALHVSGDVSWNLDEVLYNLTTHITQEISSIRSNACTFMMRQNVWVWQRDTICLAWPPLAHCCCWHWVQLVPSSHPQYVSLLRLLINCWLQSDVFDSPKCDSSGLTKLYYRLVPQGLRSISVSTVCESEELGFPLLQVYNHTLKGVLTSSSLLNEPYFLVLLELL